MPHDPDSFAEMVVLTIKAALTPVLERIAGLEARLTQTQAVEPAVAALRDRVVAVETKAALSAPVEEQVDTLTPVLERLAAVDARLGRVEAVEQSVGDVRDRLLTIETKAALPVPVVEAPTDTLTPVLERLAANDARVARLAGLELTVGELHDRLLTMETKAAISHEPPSSGPSAADVELTVREALDPLLKALAEAHERVAVLEVRASVPGPAGINGTDGKDGLDGTHGADGLAGKDGRDGLNGKDGTAGLNGKDGKDGVDGVTLDDLSLGQEDDRTMVVRGTVGARVKDIGTLTFPVEIYRGVYVDGKSYERGDGVTWGGSEWHANETTTSKPGDGSKAWTLKVKRGRDGKDGKDAESVPVVSLGRSR